MLVITAPAMIAIMMILPRDATAGAGELADILGRPLTGLSFQSPQFVQRDATGGRSGLNLTYSYLSRESHRIGKHPSKIW
ncbi:hypothetical protein D3C87_1301980 [compost metagenome]